MSYRVDFIRRVAATFGEARLTFSFLTGSRADHPRDSDVDVGVDRQSLRAADSIIRTGAFGRLMRVVEYDIPWCRAYTIEVGEPARRFRHLDIACDPWGINRLGSVLQSAVDSSSPSDDDFVPRPEAGLEAALLAVRRATERRGPD